VKSCLWVLGLVACSSSTSTPITTGDAGPTTSYGSTFTGGEFNLGPVDYQESQWHNACAPVGKYASSVQAAEGSLLAGLWEGIPNVANYCDACIYVQTAAGKSAVLRVVTYGATSDNSIDVSPEAYAILNSGEYPRSMTWQFASCTPSSGAVMYEFVTDSSEWWTSFWIRNGRVPITKVEVQSVNHPQWFELERGSDGSLTDNSGFGNGPFSIRATGIDNSQITDTFQWPASGVGGTMLTGATNF
jgi:expansin (peptidoglycan-binding protein)